MSNFEASNLPPGRSGVDDDMAWQPTALVSPATQVMRGEEEYLDAGSRDIGRDLGNGQHEMFVSCEPGDALQQQFEKLQPEYIVIHDIGTAASRRMVAGLAQACGRSVQKLVIRRQGQGIDLASIEFTEFPCADGQILRIYSTEADADAGVRHGLARTLMAYSRLAVVMVGDLPAQVLGHNLKPIGDAIQSGSWLNRQMLMLPLASAVTLATLAGQLGARGPVSVRTTPQVSRPNDAWNYIAGAWNRLREQLAQTGVTLPEIGAVQRGPAPPASAPVVIPAAAPQPRPAPPSVRTAPELPMQPMPEIPGSAKRAPSTEPNENEKLQTYVDRLCTLKGVVCASIFENSAQRSLVHAGARPGPAMLAIQGTAMLTAISDSAKKLGLGGSVPEVAITLMAHHIVLRALPKHPGLMLHMVLDKEVSNLTLAKMQIQRLDEMFD